MPEHEHDLEAQLRDALRAEVDDLQVHLTGVQLRARAHPARAWWQGFAAPIAATAAVVVAVVVGLTILGLPQPPPVGGPSPAPTVSAPLLSPSPGNGQGSPGTTRTPSGTPPPALAAPGSAIVTHRVNGALQVDILARDGGLTPLATIPGFVDRIGKLDVGGMSTSGNGYLAVWETGAPADTQVLVYDLHDPSAAPRVVDHATSADFGPTDQLAMTVTGGIDILDPRSGTTSHLASAEYPLRSWLADATGFLVADTVTTTSSGSRILLLDGTVHPIDGSIPPLQPADGGERGAPDAERVAGVHGEQITLDCHDGKPNPDGSPTQADCIATVVGSTGGDPVVWGPSDSGRARWDAGGTGLWFANGPFTYEGAGNVLLEHFDTPTHRDRLIETDGTSGTDFVKVDYAPDDTLALFRLADGRLMLFDLANAKPDSDVCGCSPAIDLGTAGTDWRLVGWTDFPDYPIPDYVPPVATPGPTPSVAPQATPTATASPSNS